MKSKQIFPPTYLLASIIAMLLLHFLLPVARIIAAPWNLSGIVILIAGVAVNIMADNLFHKVGTTVRPFEESTTLVTAGLYRFSRNPMYLGFVFILIGAAIVCGSLTPFLVTILFAVLMDREFIAHEEKILARKFGSAWQEYEAKTRRWL
jgi:protein-S-isoprenylcysteine O-methyltransferase Ste14